MTLLVAILAMVVLMMVLLMMVHLMMMGEGVEMAPRRRSRKSLDLLHRKGGD